MEPLNSPLELGLRALIVLTEAFPRSFDLDRLALMDYCLLHSADLGGPPSILPPSPSRSGELGIKRSVVEHGVQLMARAEMIELVAGERGITYRASEKASPFLLLLESPLVARLSGVARWVTTELGDISTDAVRERINRITNNWASSPIGAFEILSDVADIDYPYEGGAR